MAAQSTPPLPRGYHLGDYVIDQRIGGGGFSLVYLAYDMDGVPVAIKEYLPGGVVTRNELGMVVPISPEMQNSFRYGMKCFFDEGRALANLHHPNVVGVTNFFRANDTVYMVMKYERGKTLQRHITQLKEPMRESFIRAVFIHLLNGLREVHSHKLLHLDIKPSNIYIRADGSPVLIDFGAARQAMGHDMMQVTAMYTPGFAAPEQYNRHDQVGPWTDIYSVGASIYACIAKGPPPPADQRQEKDALLPLHKTHGGLFSKPLLTLVDDMLRLKVGDRPQSVFSVQKRLAAMAHTSRTHKPSLFAQLKERLTREL